MPLNNKNVKILLTNEDLVEAKSESVIMEFEQSTILPKVQSVALPSTEWQKDSLLASPVWDGTEEQDRVVPDYSADEMLPS